MREYKKTRLIIIGILTAGLLSGCSWEEEKREELWEQTVTVDESAGEAYTAQESQFIAQGQYFQMLQNGEYVPFYIEGVNIGSADPYSFPGELTITKQEYAEWFRQIAEMNCNTIRVYTIMMPQFYEALYEYNEAADKKLYLLQGVWYNEEQIANTCDAYDIYEEALRDACSLVDIFHGNAELKKKRGVAYGTYTCDVSKYVMGWILGIESSADFVGNTDAVHADKTSYQGRYLKTTEEATPYETFMCKLGDEVLSYEMDYYHVQRPISWNNWPTADMLTHEDEPSPEMEDAVTINVEHIQATESFEAGVFASYHIYPYYPEFLIYEGQDYVDEHGNINPYRYYLDKLIKQHTVPVLVAEYGIPTSRGVTHANPITGYDQGHVNEEDQGTMLVSMTNDIYEAGYCGGLIFTWQDEWFKRTWNTMDYTNPDRRPYWSDVQTSEQYFGLLAFDPGWEQTEVILDGSDEEWREQDVLTTNDEYTLSIKYDVRYLYLLVSGEHLHPETDRVMVPIDVTPKSGSKNYEQASFSRAADFIIDLNGKDQSEVKVHGYYDRYPVSYTAEMDKTFDRSTYGGKYDADFHSIYLCLNRQLYFPVSNVFMNYQRYKAGQLQYGNGDPDSEVYDSLSDFCYGENCIELRIPWGLLNFRDPSTKEIEADFHAAGEFKGMKIRKIYLGIGTVEDSVKMEAYTWRNWNEAPYHSRLKQSYYTVQKCFEKISVAFSNRLW